MNQKSIDVKTIASADIFPMAYLVASYFHKKLKTMLYIERHSN